MRSKIFIGMMAVALLFAVPDLLLADTFSETSNPNTNSGVCASGQLCNPLSFTNVCQFVKGVFGAVMTIGIPVATFFIIYAGFLFVTARGRPEQLTKAKHNAVYVALGVAIFLGAWFLAQIIAATIKALGGPTIMSC